MSFHHRDTLSDGKDTNKNEKIKLFIQKSVIVMIVMCHECHVSRVSLVFFDSGGDFYAIIIIKIYFYIIMSIFAPRKCK